MANDETNNEDTLENSASGNEESKSGRGFASMDEDKQREIASKGGKMAHQKGTAHEFTSEEAKEAGRKGGLARQGNAGSEKLNDVNSALDENLADDFNL